MRRKRVRDEGYIGSAGERRTMWWVRSSPMDTLRLKAAWRWQAASVFSSSAFINRGITCHGSCFPRLPGASICAGALVAIRQCVGKWHLRSSVTSYVSFSVYVSCFLKSFEVSMFVFTEILCKRWDDQREMATSKIFFFKCWAPRLHLSDKNTLKTVILWNCYSYSSILVY